MGFSMIFSFIGICLCVILKPLWRPPILYVKNAKIIQIPNGSQIDLSQKKTKCVVSRGSPPRKTWNDHEFFSDCWVLFTYEMNPTGDLSGLDFHGFVSEKTAQTDPFWGENSIPKFRKTESQSCCKPVDDIVFMHTTHDFKSLQVLPSLKLT